MGAEVNNSFTLIKAASCSGPEWFCNVCKYATDLRVRATKGSIIVARFGMSFPIHNAIDDTTTILAYSASD